MPEPSNSNRWNFSVFDGMSTEALEELLRAHYQLPDGEDSDIDSILYIMEVIAKREKDHPTGRFTDIDVASASFKEHYLPYTEDDKSLFDFSDTEEASGIPKTPYKKSLHLRQRHWMMRSACATVVIIAVMFAGTITAYALGFDLWGAVAKWTQDTFGFSNPITDTVITPSSEENFEYKNLKETLDDYGVTAEVVPLWFPDGYSFESLNVNETPVQTVIHAKYINDEDTISINITLLSELPIRTYEKDEDNVTVYWANGIEHYIMSNLDQTTIAWGVCNYECSIIGGYTVQDAEKMIESIYERN